jgi:acetolactate synthase small subunit
MPPLGLNHSRTASHPAQETWCFAVQAEASSGLMARVLELFAKRNLMPTRWHSAVPPGSAELFMDIQVAQLDRELAHYIARCIRQMVGVSTVLVSLKG